MISPSSVRSTLLDGDGGFISGHAMADEDAVSCTKRNESRRNRCILSFEEHVVKHRSWPPVPPDFTDGDVMCWFHHDDDHSKEISWKRA